MDLRIFPGRPLRGTVSLPGDKSLSHRAALLAALAEGESRVENFLVSGVTRAMLEALTALGIEWTLDGDTLRVVGKGLEGLRRYSAGRAPVRIDCGNSATTLRLLAGTIAAAGIPAVLDGSPGLRRRPMRRIVEPLQGMGVRVESASGCAPLTFHPNRQRLKPLSYELPVASAQVKSCLLLAALAADGPTTLVEPGPSRDHTERMLRGMGVEMVSLKSPVTSHQSLMNSDQFVGNVTKTNQEAKYITRLKPPLDGSMKPLQMRLPGDFSSAAFLIVAALVTPGSEITLKGVGLNPTRTGLLEALGAMGAQIKVVPASERLAEPVGDLQVRFSLLKATQVSGGLVVRMIDEFPAFAVAAAFAAGRTVVQDAEELRHKESDRISVLCEQLRRLEIDAQEIPDGFRITGDIPLGGQVDACGDHRLAMALAVAGLAAQSPVSVSGAEMISESFPGFVSALHSLGAQVEIQ